MSEQPDQQQAPLVEQYTWDHVRAEAVTWHPAMQPLVEQVLANVAVATETKATLETEEQRMAETPSSSIDAYYASMPTDPITNSDKNILFFCSNYDSQSEYALNALKTKSYNPVTIALLDEYLRPDTTEPYTQDTEAGYKRRLDILTPSWIAKLELPDDHVNVLDDMAKQGVTAPMFVDYVGHERSYVLHRVTALRHTLTGGDFSSSSDVWTKFTATLAQMIATPELYNNEYVDSAVLKSQLHFADTKPVDTVNDLSERVSTINTGSQKALAAGYSIRHIQQFLKKHGFSPDEQAVTARFFAIGERMGDTSASLCKLLGLETDPIAVHAALDINIDTPTLVDDVARAKDQLQALYKVRPDLMSPLQELTESVDGNMLGVQRVPKGFEGLQHPAKLSELAELFTSFQNPDEFVKLVARSALPHGTYKNTVRAFSAELRTELLNYVMSLDRNSMEAAGDFDQLCKNTFMEFSIAPNPYVDQEGAFFGHPLTQKIAEFGLRNGHISGINKYLQRTAYSAKILQEVEQHYIGQATYPMYLAEVARLPASEQPVLSATVIKLFGAYASKETAAIVDNILSGRPSRELTELGITSVGQAGIDTLRAMTSKVAAEIRSADISDETLGLLEHSVALRSILKQITRYDELGDFGNHDDYSLAQGLHYWQEAKRDGRILPLDETYTRSNVVSIATFRERSSLPEWRDNVIAEYTTLRDEIESAASELAESGSFTRLFADVTHHVKEVVDSIDDTLAFDTGLHPAKAENLRQQLPALRALLITTEDGKPSRTSLRTLVDFQNNFSVLARHKELHPSVRKVIFAMAVRQNPGWQQKVYEFRDNPSQEQVSTMREFVEHIVNQETFSRHFNNKNDVQTFKKMASTDVLEAALTRLQKSGQAGKQIDLQFVPTRGALLELSGHIGDACWASKYASIAEVMPNMTAVIMKQNPDTTNEKLVGAGLLLEMNSSEGQPILLIRGLNPLENFINNVSIQQFYTQFTDYAAGIAKKQGRQLAVVVDEAAGHAATNRPALFNYLSQLRKTGELKPVLLNSMDTTFNGYDVHEDSYLIPAK